MAIEPSSIHMSRPNETGKLAADKRAHSRLIVGRPGFAVQYYHAADFSSK
jgi:hypothetical protein